MGQDLDVRLRERARLGVDDLLDLGCDLADAGRSSDAESCFRLAMAQGSAAAAFDLGNCLGEQGRWREAVEAYELAIRGGVDDAWLNLGGVLHELGDLAGEMQAYRQAEAASDPGGALGLAFALHEQGDCDGALAAARRAAVAGHAMAAGVVACWQWSSTRDPSLEPALRAGADVYPSARADLADLLASTGRVDEARQVLELGMSEDEVESMVPLGYLCESVYGDREAAAAAYQAGVDHGDAYAHHNLAVLREEAGDLDGARWHYCIAAENGDTLAAAALDRLTGP